MEPSKTPTPVRPPRDPSRRSTGATAGLILWRGGLYFTAAYIAFQGSKWILDVLLAVGIPAQILLGVSLMGGGAVIVLVSLVVERIEDARAEKGLKDLY